MTTFIVTILIIHILSIGINISELNTKTFPYTQEKTYLGVWVNIAIALGIAIWAGVLVL